MKKFILLFILSLTIGIVNAQKVKLKKGDVIVDGESCLNYESTDSDNFKISTKDGSQTILLKYKRTGVGYNDGVYLKIIFVELDKSLTSRLIRMTNKRLVKKFISDGLIVDCKFNPEEIEKFVKMYDQQIE
ncbi:hypothetical protein [Halocola ammonii]